MKKFLFQIFLFLIPILILVCFGEIYMRNRPSVYGQKQEQLLSNADNVEILILGNSQTTYGINPNEFTLYAYNLAFEDQSVYFDRKLTEKFLPALPHLKYVVINIGYNNLCFEHAADRDFFYKYYYGIDYKEHRRFWKEWFLQSFFVYSPERTWTLIFRDLKIGLHSAIEEKGWIDRPTNLYEVVTSAEKGRMKAARFNANLKKYDRNQPIIEDFEWIIDALKSKGITPILITCPNYQTIRNSLDKAVLGKSQSAINFLSKKYDVLYLDYFEDNRFEIPDYYDCDHLNTSGAQKLTAAIDSVILSLERDAELKITELK